MNFNLLQFYSFNSIIIECLTLLVLLVYQIKKWNKKTKKMNL